MIKYPLNNRVIMESFDVCGGSQTCPGTFRDEILKNMKKNKTDPSKDKVDKSTQTEKYSVKVDKSTQTKKYSLKTFKCFYFK